MSDSVMTDLLYPVRRYDQISPRYRGTPIADLLAFHNLGKPAPCYVRADLLIGMCMDNRKDLNIPSNKGAVPILTASMAAAL